MTSSLATQDRTPERGQILVIFTIALVTLIGVVGLVIDVGATFAQRRTEQNVADLAALGGATTYLNTPGDAFTRRTAAQASAVAIASQNGFASGVGGVSLAVNVAGDANYGSVSVAITKPHVNAFVRLLGFGSWDVSVDATAVASQKPNAAKGLLPLLFNEQAFPDATCDLSTGTCANEIQIYQAPQSGSEDVPQDATQFNWTIFCIANGNPCNANSNGVEDIMEGGGTETYITIDEMIGPLNAGSHTTLYDSLEAWEGELVPVPIVCTTNYDRSPLPTCPYDGAMVGFAYFYLVDSDKSSKSIQGFFVSPVEAEELHYVPTAGQASLQTGTYGLRLTQ